MVITIPPARRSPDRPVLEPRDGKQFWWESKGTFNAGVAEYKNHILLLYRAYDSNYISRLGLATSQDGINFKRYANPAVDTDPDDPFERMGIEDPRVTLVDGTYYILHTSASFNRVGAEKNLAGAGAYLPWRVRVGLHSTKDWHSYTHHGIILADVAAKNAILLPQKIRGHFVLLYRVWRDEQEIVTISLTKDFRQWVETKAIHLPPAEEWRGLKWGLGSQPIETEHGYLLVYHGVDIHGTYRLGLMLLDRDDPSKAIWYSGPILEPEMEYERVGYVPNVVYCCGAIIRDNELWMYYGAGDKVTARAVLPLPDIFHGDRT